MRAGRLILIVLLASVLAVAGALTYKRWPRPNSQTTRDNTSPSGREQSSAVPPFSTKEPPTYQATRIISTTDSDTNEAQPVVTKVSIARSGESRREDYESYGDSRIVYLDIPAGNFVLLPAKKVFAQIKSGSTDLSLPTAEAQAEAGADFSTEALLSETPSVHYEKLGTENLSGRSTTKYRVTSARGTGIESTSTSLIWVDEVLGMPIRSETETSEAARHAKVIIEMRDIELQVDPRLFELPAGYQRIDEAELLKLLKPTGIMEPRPQTNRTPATGG
jgi:outer membrane lipoprotein-sorting protein